MTSSELAINCLLFGPPIFGLLWALFQFSIVSSIKLDRHSNHDGTLRDHLFTEHGDTAIKQLSRMKIISGNIARGSAAFLYHEGKYLLVFVLLFSLLIGLLVDYATMFAFEIGAFTSMLSGFIGMKIAVRSNVRCTYESWKDLGSGFSVALRAGSVIGFAVVSLDILFLGILIIVYKHWIFDDSPLHYKELFEAIAGYGLGASSVALFARVGGGIFTKAADVGADLSGKNDFNVGEDDPRNPACIADNVGDNVGDVAGMGADLFGSLAEATCACLVITGSSSALLKDSVTIASSWSGMMMPLLISSTGILVGIFTLFVCLRFFQVKNSDDVEYVLKSVLLIATVIETPVIIGLCMTVLPKTFIVATVNDIFIEIQWWRATVSILCGLWSGLTIGFITEYYTSHSFSPVREIAETQKVSAATGIIYGLALGFKSTVVPAIFLAGTMCVSHNLCGMYGVALAALGMLSTLTVCLAIDGYGPISDNAGGIAEMAGLGPEVRKRTDAMDAAGNTTAAVGKGFAIGSAALVGCALFGAYTVRTKILSLDILDSWCFFGLLLGAMLPFAFFALTLKSVGTAANEMVAECHRQFPLIIQGIAEPEYYRCIAISTQASLKEMIAPGALVMLTPILVGMAFGKNCLAGLLAGSIVCGISLAIAGSNAGGAWDNAKKYIETGALGNEHGKGSDTHKNSVTGDTVGDPLKDTSGPSLNILVKLSAIISLIFGPIISLFSNFQGGPFWI